MRVVFSGGGTGGHLYPALSIARALMRERPDVRPHFVGAWRGIERDVLPETEFPYTLLDAHPLYRQQPWRNWRTMRGGVTGWRAMSRLAREERPRMVVGTGGYASSIAVTWARFHGVPIVQQVGDAVPGMASRAFARWSLECYLGYPEAQIRLSRAKCVVTGNPIEPPPDPRPDRGPLLERWGLPADTRVLLVFGGSQGARAINDAVAQWLSRGLPEGWSLIWATGKGMYDTFRGNDAPRVRVRPYLAPIADAYAVTDLALVRGGMMGTAECCAWGIPMIVVPLPTAAADHQTWNARSLEEAGAAIHLAQRDLSADRLAALTVDLIENPRRLAAIADGALRRGRPHAAAEIARRISALLSA